MCASSCWKRRTRVSPVSAPDISFLHLQSFFKVPAARIFFAVPYPRGCTLFLSPVKHSKVGISDGQLVEGVRLMAEHQTVSRAIHRLQAKLLLLHFEAAIARIMTEPQFSRRATRRIRASPEHVLCVVLPVTRRLPQLRVVHVWSDDLAQVDRVPIAQSSALKFSV